MTFGSSLTRRNFLAMGAVVASGAALASPSLTRASAALTTDLPRWSDPLTWGGAVPRPGAQVTVDQPVLLDVDAVVGGLEITPAGELVFDPDAGRTLASSGNVVVLGALRMRPAAASVEHVLRFVGVDERAFVGGGMEVLPNDVGLWCREDGVLDVAGTPRLAWARTATDVPVGSRTITLQTDPAGWLPGDELVITPTAGPAASGNYGAYDYSTIVSVTGRTVVLSTATAYPHPVVDVGDGVRVAPEVLNLTRNVRLEGTPTGRAHIWLMPSVQQHMSYFSSRWMGPRKADGRYTQNVLGRYGLHFHMGDDATRGSTVVGAVVRDTGSHAFVPHQSHGISFVSCISHNTYDEAYWWDQMVDTRTAGPSTHDTEIRACVASMVKVDPDFRGTRLAGFLLGLGNGNIMRDCVAVGVQGNLDAGGFAWPEGPGSGVWTFQNCVSHNNKRNGILVWQNNSEPHRVEQFVCMHNGGSGIVHGAYVNSYRYDSGYLYGNAESGLVLHAGSSQSGGPLRFVNLLMNGAGAAEHAVLLVRHQFDPFQSVEFLRCRFVGQRTEGVVVVPTAGPGQKTTPEMVDFVDCTCSTTLLRYRDDTLRQSRIRVQTGAVAELAQPRIVGGPLRPAWNAVVTPVPSFYTQPLSDLLPVTLAPDAGVPLASRAPRYHMR